MYNILKISLLLVLFTLASHSEANNEVSNYLPYKLLSGATTEDSHTVRMFFLVDCPYCRKMHHSMMSWEKTLPKNSYRVEYVPAVVDEKYMKMGIAVGAASTFDRTLLEKFITASYQLVQDEGFSIDQWDTYFTAATRAGIDIYQYKEKLIETANNQKVQKMIDLTDRSEISVVPSIVIDGLYATNLGYTGGNYDLFFNLLNGLVSKGVAHNE